MRAIPDPPHTVTSQYRADSDIDIAAYFGGRPPSSFDVLLPPGADLLVLDEAPLELAGQPGLVGGLAEQDRAGVADQPGPVSGDLMGMVPPVMHHGEERSRSVDYKVVVTRNLPGPGRSSLLNQRETPAHGSSIAQLAISAE